MISIAAAISANENLIDKPEEAAIVEKTLDVLSAIGRNIRHLRTEGGLTLQSLADRTGLSPSMLSLLERGKTGPSIGTLVVIASALGAQMSDLLDAGGRAEDGMVSRVKDQLVFHTDEGVMRRVLKQDRARNIEIAMNEYAPGTGNAPVAQGHDGYEFGVVLEGTLEVTVSGTPQTLLTGDVISFPSPQPHRFSNPGHTVARTLWINLRRG